MLGEPPTTDIGGTTAMHTNGVSWPLLYSVCLLSCSTSGAQEVDISSPPAPTPDTSLLVSFDTESLTALSAGGEARVITEGGQPAEGRFGRAIYLGPGEMLSYGAAGNLDLNRGTLELWVNEDWSPEQRGQTHYLVSHPLDWMAPGNMRLWYWAITETTGLLRFDCHAVAPHGDGYVTATWPGRGWHHIAARWDHRDGIALYVDGRKVAEQRGTWAALPPAEGALEISHPERSADAAIDGLRIRGRPFAVLLLWMPPMSLWCGLPSASQGGPVPNSHALAPYRCRLRTAAQRRFPAR